MYLQSYQLGLSCNVQPCFVFVSKSFEMLYKFLLLVRQKEASVVKIKIKIKKLCLTSRFETDNISSVEL